MTVDQHATAARVVLVPNRHLLFRCKYLGLGVSFGARVAFGADVVLQQLDDFLTGLTEPRSRRQSASATCPTVPSRATWYKRAVIEF